MTDWNIVGNLSLMFKRCLIRIFGESIGAAFCSWIYMEVSPMPTSIQMRKGLHHHAQYPIQRVSINPLDSDHTNTDNAAHTELPVSNHDVNPADPPIQCERINEFRLIHKSLSMSMSTHLIPIGTSRKRHKAENRIRALEFWIWSSSVAVFCYYSVPRSRFLPALKVLLFVQR